MIIEYCTLTMYFRYNGKYKKIDRLLVLCYETILKEGDCYAMERFTPCMFWGGGISKEIYMLVEDINRAGNQQVFDFIGFIGSKKSDVSTEIINGKKVVSYDDDILKFAAGYPIIGMIIPIGNPKIKAEIFDRVQSIPNVVFPNIIHPTTSFDKGSIKMGVGNIITAGAKLTCNINIGDFNLINLNSTIGHDVVLGNFNVVNPLVAISGNVEVKDFCLIGTGAKILQGLSIGNHSIVGAGAVVVKDVEAGTTVVGVPAKPKKTMLDEL
ncbi:MAG: acetyltransferase [Clostridiales bacterium]|nr:acetyltransferase [Clostridiales bacterium]